MFALIHEQSVSVFPYDLFQLAQDNPTVSFSFPLSEEELAQWNVFPVYDEHPIPIVDPATQECKLSDPKLVNGQWVRKWEIRDLSEQEKIDACEIKSAELRRTRNNHLAACDWTQLPDAPLSSEEKTNWTTYRQTLRDITSRPEFPWGTVLPTWPGFK